MSFIVCSLFSLVLICFISSCEDSTTTKDLHSKLPTLTTNLVSHIEDSMAICGGLITSDGGFEISARGVCWDTNPNPSINNLKTIDDAGTGIFESKLSKLIPNTTYYIRSYATNKYGTAYGLQLEFKTLPKQSWRQIADAPKPHPYLYGFGIGNKGYVFAYSGDGNVLYEYDPSLNYWSNKAGNAIQLKYSTVISTFSINNFIYVFANDDNRLFEYNPSLNRWVSSNFTYENSSLISTFTINNKAYIIYFNVPKKEINGNFTYSNILWEFDAKNTINKWVKKSNCPANCDNYNKSTTCFSINNNGYVLSDGQLYLYDQLTNKWSQKSDAPHFSGRVPSAFVLNNRVYVGAGRSLSSYNTLYKDFWEYNPILDTWKQIDDFGGLERMNAASFVVNSIAYFGMGLTNNGYVVDFWRFKP